MSRYAAATTVDAGKTEAEIIALLRKHGATGRAIGEYGRDIIVLFELHGRHIRFGARLPHPDDARYLHDNGNYRKQARPLEMRRRLCAQDVRQRWRSILLRLKARLEELADLAEMEAQEGDVDLTALTEGVFLGQVLLPDRHTVEEYLVPQLDETYRTGHMPPLLPGASTPLLLPAPEGTP